MLGKGHILVSDTMVNPVYADVLPVYFLIDIYYGIQLYHAFTESVLTLKNAALFFFLIHIITFYMFATISIWGFLRYIYILVMKMNIKVVIIHVFIVKIKICPSDIF